jgi:hypothetical protein
VKLARLDGEHVQTCHGTVREKLCNVIAAYLKTNRFFEGNGCHLVRGLLQHGRKAKKLPMDWLMHDHLLLVVVSGGDLRLAGHDHVAVFGGITGFEDALAWGEFRNFHLCRQNAGFVVIEKLEERNVS